jgi:AhpD family alkylhydroperoxidase
MTEFTIHTAESAPEASREALATLERTIGFIPNLAGTIAGSATALQGFVAMQSALRGTAQLSPLEREVVGLAVSYANRSRYSMAAHSTFAAGAGASADVLAALRSGAELPDARLEAIHVLTTVLLSDRGHVAEDDLAAFMCAGYSIENALEVITQIAYTTLANFVANVADTPVDDAFAAHAWTATPA